MSKMKFQSILGGVFKLTAISVAATLVACGGGSGGGGSPTGSVTPGEISVVPPAPPVVDTGIVTSVPLPTYAAGSGEKAAYDVLNAARSRCGFGLLAQSSNLDVAAAAQTKYSETNGVLEHTQEPTKPDFYGQGANDRLLKAGYAFSNLSESLTGMKYDNNLTPAQLGDFAVRNLLAAPYHAIDMMRGYRDVGISVGSFFTTLNYGVAKGKELQQSSDVRTFPCEGTTETVANTSRESPNPFPSEGQSAIWGQPIMISGASDLRIVSATITGPSGSVAIRAIYGNGGTNDAVGVFTKDRAVVIPFDLKTNSTYSVSIKGTNKGADFTREFSFSTGPHTIDRGDGFGRYYPSGAF